MDKSFYLQTYIFKKKYLVNDLKNKTTRCHIVKLNKVCKFIKTKTCLSGNVYTQYYYHKKLKG